MAVAGINRDKPGGMASLRDLAAISELMRRQKMPDAQRIQNESIDWTNLINN